ncbi:hypothetical protein ACVGWB_15720 [Enterobacter mori]|uniref:hypothetical protein n=1 Tax=Enterobacter cloacae complex TaxID=354276 RepID=UPI0007925438|nr:MULTISPECIES: hypothetical protein [Enterobacter cloacae complex]CAG0342339.1 hypothetical protein AN2364V1_3155 [Enterobacter cloacae]MBJ6475968.1 hypothetical protein [Enterobacter hormaechei]MBJ6546010.1 hypothetical protein [Enterobacter hormaechei]MBJ6552021.1 hypothetical protein [Enterobacter hormaechei]MBK4390417.1 hypothetical protein [Enterobacter hormaechei]
MAEEKRRVKVTGLYDKPEGTFIKFAPMKFYDDANQLHTAEQAIVELDNGRVINVEPSSIQFIKD